MKFETYLFISEIIKNLSTTCVDSNDNTKINYSQTFLYNVYDNLNIGFVNLNWIGKNSIETYRRARSGEGVIKIGEYFIIADIISYDNNNNIDYQKVIYGKTNLGQDVVINSFLDNDKLFLIIDISI